MSRVYLYGVVDSGEEADLGIPGLDGSDSLSSIGHRGIGCVVSDYRGEGMEGMPTEKLVRCLLRHQQAVERVMKRHTVVPVKFGTLLEGVAEARAMLAQGYAQLADALAFMCDKVEIEVAATWDTARLLQEIGHEEEVARARGAITRNGGATVAQRMGLGQVVKASMDRRRDMYRERMLAVLQPQAVDQVANPLISDDLVMNVAFLVERHRQREFDEAVQRLDDLFQDQINFRVIGPLPPYSFSTLEVSRLTQEQLEDARQTLELEGAISAEAVRKAYRSLAAEAQRSLAASGPQAGDLPQRLRRASDLLLGYCQARDGALAGEEIGGPASPEVGSHFVVTVRRSQSLEIEQARFGGPGRM